jgi:hypothetical protein
MHMIAFYRTASIAPGRTRESMVFAHEIAAYIQDLTGTEVTVAVPVGGNPNRVGWATQYENLAGLEEMMGKLMADEKYLELVANGSVNFNAGSVHDDIWATV